MSPIELGNITVNGESVQRTYEDTQAGFRGLISSSIGSPKVHINHIAAEGAEPIEGKVAANNSNEAELTVIEDEAAVSAILGVIEGRQATTA